MRKWLKENQAAIVLSAFFIFSLFLVCLAGKLRYNQEMKESDQLGELNHEVSTLGIENSRLISDIDELYKGFDACVQLRENVDKPIIDSYGKLTEFARSYIILEEVVKQTKKKYTKVEE